MLEGAEVRVGRGRVLLDKGRVHLGGELQKSLQILDQAVVISGYVNGNHV